MGEYLDYKGLREYDQAIKNYTDNRDRGLQEQIGELNYSLEQTQNTLDSVLKASKRCYIEVFSTATYNQGNNLQINIAENDARPIEEWYYGRYNDWGILAPLFLTRFKADVASRINGIQVNTAVLDECGYPELSTLLVMDDIEIIFPNRNYIGGDPNLIPMRDYLLYPIDLNLYYAIDLGESPLMLV